MDAAFGSADDADLFGHAAFILEKCNKFGDKWRDN